MPSLSLLKKLIAYQLFLSITSIYAMISLDTLKEALPSSEELIITQPLPSLQELCLRNIAKTQDAHTITEDFLNNHTTNSHAWNNVIYQYLDTALTRYYRHLTLENNTDTSFATLSWDKKYLITGNKKQFEVRNTLNLQKICKSIKLKLKGDIVNILPIKNSSNFAIQTDHNYLQIYNITENMQLTQKEYTICPYDETLNYKIKNIAFNASHNAFIFLSHDYSGDKSLYITLYLDQKIFHKRHLEDFPEEDFYCYTPKPHELNNSSFYETYSEQYGDPQLLFNNGSQAIYKDFIYHQSNLYFFIDIFNNQKILFTYHSTEEMPEFFQSLDSSLLVILEDTNLILMDVKTKKIINTHNFFTVQEGGWFSSTNKSIQTLSIAPNNNFIVTFHHYTYAAGESTAFIWDCEGYHELAQPPNQLFRYTKISISPDSSLIVFGTTSGALVLYDAQTKKYLLTIKAHKSRINNILILPNQTIISQGRSIKIWKPLRLFFEEDTSFPAEKALILKFLYDKKLKVKKLCNEDKFLFDNSPILKNIIRCLK